MATMPKELSFPINGEEYKAILVDKDAPRSSTARCIGCQQPLHDRAYYTTSPQLFDVHVDCAQRSNIHERLISTGEDGSLLPPSGKSHFLGPLPYYGNDIHSHHDVYCHENYCPPPPSPTLSPPSPLQSTPPPPPRRSIEPRPFGSPPYYGQNSKYSYPPPYYSTYGNGGLPYHDQQQPNHHYPPNYYYEPYPPPPPSYHPPKYYNEPHPPPPSYHPPNYYYEPHPPPSYHPPNYYYEPYPPPSYPPPNYYYEPPPTSYHPPKPQGGKTTSGIAGNLGIAAFGAFLQALISSVLNPGGS